MARMSSTERMAPQGYAGGFAFQNNGNDGVNDRGVGHGLKVHMQAGVGDGVVLRFYFETGNAVRTAATERS